MGDLAEYRKVHPSDDLTSALVNATIDGESLTHSEVASFFLELVSAGNETIQTAIAHGMLALSEHPDQRALWQSDVEGLRTTAVEEIVRWASPVNWMRRTVTADTALCGTELHEGDKVVLFYGAANRDPAVFADPYRFDLRREPNAHLSFGAPGPHYCLGAHLARCEIGALFAELFVALPDLEVSGPAIPMRSSFVNGIKHLPCSFTPSG